MLDLDLERCSKFKWSKGRMGGSQAALRDDVAGHALVSSAKRPIGVTDSYTYIEVGSPFPTSIGLLKIHK